MSLTEIRVLMGLNSRFPSVLEATISAFESVLAEGEDDPTHDASDRAQHLSKVAAASRRPGHHLDAHAQHAIAKAQVQKKLSGLPKDDPDRRHLETMLRHHERFMGIHTRMANASGASAGGS